MMKKFNRYLRLSRAIKKVLAVGMSGLMLTPSTTWAEGYINPNEMWFDLSNSTKICSLDFDQDGDLDLVHYYREAVTLQINVGTLESPLFAPQKVIVNISHLYLVKELNNPQSCVLEYKRGGSIDIDHDGDLDLFSGADVSNKIGNITSTPLIFREKTEGGFKYIDHTFGLPSTAQTMNFVDIDQDGDDDVFINGANEFYKNIGTPEAADFIKQDHPLLKCGDKRYYEGAMIDLNGDQQLDLICKDKTALLSSPMGYIEKDNLFQDSFNVLFDHTYKRPTLDINQNGSPELAVIFDDIAVFEQVRDIERGAPLYKYYHPYGEALQTTLQQCGLNLTPSILNFFVLAGFSDFDGDGDDDVFAVKASNSHIVYCENKGTADSPLYSSVIDMPSMNHIESSFESLIIDDLDGDGDPDLYGVGILKGTFYDNVGTNDNPVFEHISHIAIPSHFSWLDLDNNGRIDSFLNRQLLVNKGLEPVIDIEIKPYKFNNAWHYVVAVNRPSQVQIFNCSVQGACNQPEILPNTAKEISLSVGSFSHSSENGNVEIALTMIDKDGFLSLNIYDFFYGNFNLISRGQGGKAHSISTSAGQLDNDPEDEVALTFVEENGKVVSAGVNFDMSIVGAALQEVGKNPSIAVGKFSDTSGSYVMTYITPDNQLKILTIQGNGTIISQIDGGSASDATVSKSTFVSSTSQDEYIVSTHQANGMSGLTGFLSDGNVLGQLSFGATQQPTIISRYSESKVSLGLAVSVIQADKKPAVIFLDNLGNILATGVGGKTAMVATVADGGNGNAILAYVDEDGIPRWETFSADGVKQP